MRNPDVLLLRWPEEDHRRPEHAGTPRPTLLVLERGGPAPRQLGAMEDWVFHDADPEEVALRVSFLAGRRAQDPDEPYLEDGLLRNGDRWTAISESQLPVVDLLVQNLERVVSIAALTAAYAAAGGSTETASIRSLVHRLGQRFDDVGLQLRRIRGRGLRLSLPESVVPGADQAASS